MWFLSCHVKKALSYFDWLPSPRARQAVRLFVALVALLVHLVDLLGPLPSPPGGRAVWCHHALGIEAMLDREATAQSLRGNSDQLKQFRHQILVADRVFRHSPEEGFSKPGVWLLCGANTAACPPGSLTGTLLSPPLGFHSAAMQHITSIQIDPSGNYG